MLNYIEFLGIPATIAIVIVAVFLFLQIVGEILEFKGKAVPEIVKIRKYFKRRKEEKNEMKQTLKEVEQLLSDVNSHYSSDNISKRNSWMKWVNDRADVYDNSIVEINNKLTDITQVLKNNTKTTEELFVENSRDRIIDFASKVVSNDIVVSREEFNRIFKVYKRYEDFLEEHNLTNGEVDIAYHIIQEAYENHIRKHSFIEDVRGYSI